MKAEPELIINLKNQILIGKYKKLFKIYKKNIYYPKKL